MYWLLGDGPPRIIEEVAVPMPGAESAQVAEAHAAADAVCIADQVRLKHGVPIGDELLIVGDSDMVTRCIRGRARDKAPDVKQALEAARSSAATKGRPIKAMHVPREANSGADRVANTAAMLARACQGRRAAGAHVGCSSAPGSVVRATESCLASCPTGRSPGTRGQGCVGSERSASWN